MTADPAPAPGGGRGILLVLDGWGEAPPADDNALTLAETPTLTALRADYPSTLLEASGQAVGLPAGTVGNSEIGHLVIGAGRPLPYDSLLVQRAIADGSLRAHPLLAEACGRLAATGCALHLVGLCSDGQIHAHVEHLADLLAAAAAHEVRRVYVHAITDGRDVSDGTAGAYLRRVQELAAHAGVGRIATVVGRGYALDKSGDRSLTEAAALAMADGIGARVADPLAALDDAPRGDEWITPAVVTDPGGAPIGAIAGSDAVLLFNFRSDRIQQLADFIVAHLASGDRSVSVLSLTRYDTDAAIPPLIERADARGGLADEFDRHAIRSVRIAESEKFEHVTYYLNGRDATKRALEEHRRIERTEPPDYITRPEMNLGRVVDAVAEAARRPDVALVVANLANIDVVGHTGNLPATIAAAQHTDAAVARILQAAQESGRWVLLVGDHGNAETMTRPGGDGAARPYGGHTTNPVPLVIVPTPSQPAPGSALRRGSLADVAPTVLALLGHEPGTAMTGRPLL